MQSYLPGTARAVAPDDIGAEEGDEDDEEGDDYGKDPCIPYTLNVLCFSITTASACPCSRQLLPFITSDHHITSGGASALNLSTRKLSLGLFRFPVVVVHLPMPAECTRPVVWSRALGGYLAEDDFRYGR